MTNYLEHIGNVLMKCKQKDIQPHETAVLGLLIEKWQFSHQTEKISQDDISRTILNLGKHWKYEGQMPTKKKSTTNRKVRQLIRNLRVKYGVPILSDRDGYWLPKSEKEAGDYIDRLELLARAQAKAWYETYEAMSSALEVSSEYFESQSTLF